MLLVLEWFVFILLGYGTVSALLEKNNQVLELEAIKYCFCVLIGLAIYSGTTFLLIVLKFPVEVSAILGSLILFILSVLDKFRLEVSDGSSFPRFLRNNGFFTFILSLALYSQWVLMRLMPHGGWDAWAIWNYHARIITRTPSMWIKIFQDPLIAYSHTDYPLMQPLAISHAWSIVGESQVVPIIFSLVVTALLLTSVYAFVTLYSSKLFGLLAVMLLVSSPIFWNVATNQYADLLLSAYITSAMIMLLIITNPGYRGSILLFGLIVGFTAWVKNEGLMFSVITSSIVIWMGTRRFLSFAELRRYLCGVVPGILLLLAQRVIVNVSNDVINTRTIFTKGDNVLDLGRHLQIASSMAEGLTHYFRGFFDLSQVLSLLFFVSLLQTLTRKSLRLGIILVTAQLFGYYMVYLVSPHNLTWHLSSSVDRLISHVAPSLVIITIVGYAKLAKYVQEGSDIHLY